MGKLVTPQVYLIGYTTINSESLRSYLVATENQEFIDEMYRSKLLGVSEAEMLISFYAKLCYKSLTLGKNENVSKIRGISENIKGCIDSGHGSIFEHIQLNFVVTNCSRVFTHELVRHRVGTAFSQTSGRYVRGDSVDMVFDPILEPVKAEIETLQYLIEERYNIMVKKMKLDTMKDFNLKKKITSALRRVLPNGQSNEIGFSINLRALRHLIMLRTSEGAEWEIREVFAQIYNIVKSRYPLIFCDAKEEIVDGLLKVSGMKMQPYEESSN